MRIGFFGNTGNYPFLLARAMREEGHDLLFFVDQTDRLNRPEHRFTDVRVPYPDWVVDVSQFRVLWYVVPNTRRRTVLEGLRSCDAVVLNGLAPALWPDIRRPAIAWLTGSDLENWANLENTTARSKPIRRSPEWFWHNAPRLAKPIFDRLVRAQREGIRSAAGVVYFPEGVVPSADRILHGIGVNSSQRFFFYLAQLEGPPPDFRPRHLVPRVLCVSRQNWKRPRPEGSCEMDMKGSDLMVHGLALFSRQTGLKLDIRLVKKGWHVAEAMELVRSEGLENQVTWLEEMSQLAVEDEFRNADIVLEQFGTTGLLGMAGLDAMAAGKPVIASVNTESINKAIGGSIPVCNARTPDEISDQLSRLMDEDVRQSIARASRRYVEIYCSPRRAVQMCLDRFASCLAMPNTDGEKA